MKIIKDCWNVIGVSECIFGAHLFEKSIAKIYVAKGLDVGPEMSRNFFQKDEEGFVGHCLLVFHGVRFFDFSVNSYEMHDGNPIWHDPVVFHYKGLAPDTQKEGQIKKYSLGGGLSGFLAYVAGEIEAENFELHILDEHESG